MAANQQTPQAPADNAKDIKDNKTTSSKKLVTGEVKDPISKGSTMVGKTPENPSGKPDQIDINPMQNEGILSQLNDIYDRVLSELDTHLRDDGTTSLTNIYKKDTPGEVVNNKFALQFKNPKNDKEAASRSGNPARKEMDIVRRNDANADRKTDSAYYRHQSIVKNVIDEAKKSAWERMLERNPKHAESEVRAQQAKAGLEKAGKDYQKILDGEARSREAAAKNKTNEQVSGCDIDELTEEELGFTEENFIPSGNELYEDWNELEEEAEYQGRKVKLGKPFLTPGGPKKRSVYVKNEGGNVVKVNFGDPNMTIKKNIPARRKSFRARHHCDTNPGPRTKARYWSCRAW
jgi:hypothetical protein